MSSVRIIQRLARVSSRNLLTNAKLTGVPYHSHGYLVNVQFNLVPIVNFSRIRKGTGSKRVERTANSSENRIATAPAPAAPVNIEECWVEVQDKASGQMYWWNTATNETTALGAPKPTGASALAHPQPQQQQSGGLGSVLAEGFAFGTGSAIAHNVVGSFFGGGGHHHDHGSSDTSGGGDDSSWDV